MATFSSSEKSEISKFHYNFFVSPSVTETVKFFLRVPAKSAHGNFIHLKS